MSDIKAVIFDIGNVLIEWQPERFYDAIIGVDRRKEMFQCVDLHGMNDVIDAGGSFKQTIYDWAERTPEFRTEIRMWHDRWIEMATPEISLSWQSLRALRRKGIPVFALSNFGIESFAYAQTHYPALAEFDQRFISGHLGVIKPDAEIYQIVEKTAKLSGSELLFTDDRQDNIDAANAHGWHTHLFANPQGWLEKLYGLSLLTPDDLQP